MSASDVRADEVVVLFSLVPYLRSRGAQPATIGELATRFGTAPENMRRLVERIATNGTDAAEYSTFFDLDWDALEERDEVRITHFVAFEHPPILGGHERAALIAGLHYLAGTQTAERRLAITALIEKLGGAAPIASMADAATGQDATRIAEAIAEGRRLRFRYRALGSEDAVRRVDPIRLASLDDEPFLIAWCLDRDARRTFRLDRMRELETLDERAEPHPEAAAGGLYASGPDDLTARLRVSTAALPQALEFLAEGASAPAANASGAPVELEARFARLERVARLAAEHAGRIEVVAPSEARAAAAEWARLALEGYDRETNST